MNFDLSFATYRIYGLLPFGTLEFGQVCPRLGHVQRPDLNASVWVCTHKDYTLSTKFAPKFRDTYVVGCNLWRFRGARYNVRSVFLKCCSEWVLVRTLLHMFLI